MIRRISLAERRSITRAVYEKHGYHVEHFYPYTAIPRYLVRLTKTPTGGVVLDPFAGSGTTGMACRIEGREFIGFEKESEYVEIANRRIPAAFDALEPDPGPRVKDLPGQKMLFEEP